MERGLWRGECRTHGGHFTAIGMCSIKPSVGGFGVPMAIGAGICKGRILGYVADTLKDGGFVHGICKGQFEGAKGRK